MGNYILRWKAVHKAMTGKGNIKILEEPGNSGYRRRDTHVELSVFNGRNICEKHLSLKLPVPKESKEFYLS